MKPMTDTQRAEVAEILGAVKERYKNPAAWVQGHYYAFRLPSGRTTTYRLADSIQCFCLVGAVQDLASGDRKNALRRRVYRTLVEAMPKSADRDAVLRDIYSDARVIEWNDEGGRTIRQVRTLVNRALKSVSA